MQNKFRNFLLPPVFVEDQTRTRVAGLLNVVLLALLSLALLTLPIMLSLSMQGAERRPMATVELLFTIFFVVFLIVLRQLLFRGIVAPVAWVVLISQWLATAYLIYNYGSISNILPILFVLSLLFAIHTLGRRAGFISLGVTSTVMLALALLEQAGRLPAKPSFSVMDQFFYYVGVSLVMVVLTGTVQQNLLTAYKHTYDNEKVLRKSNQELLFQQAALEKHASDRTTELEKRAAQLQTISRLARTIASMQELDTLLPSITRLVSEQFGFYHTGIFLLDEANEYAVLKASNSEGGIRLLHHGHRLVLDSESIVGYAASRGEPRIALDVGADSVYFNNPDLPETRSEMALPLRVVGRVIGALDVQSTETNAFSQEDIFVLYTLADQIAIAIENARLYGQAQKALRDSQATFDKYVKQEWSSFIQQSSHNGFVFDGKHVVPLDKQSKREHMKPVIQTGRLLRERSSSTIAVPIKLRGQTIGMLDARSQKGSREWTADEIALLEAAAERAALALENARLVEGAQRRASRERSIGEISARIGSVSDIDLILQAAVEELGRKLSGATEVTLEINNNDQQALQ
jgi:GAF domain-containing protein